MPEKVDCPELGVVTKQDIFDACISNPMKAFVEIDWRDFFPAFKWVPNKTLENKIKAIERRRTLIMKGLVQEQRKSIEKEVLILFVISTNFNTFYVFSMKQIYIISKGQICLCIFICLNHGFISLHLVKKIPSCTNWCFFFNF